jgi:predicted ATPase
VLGRLVGRERELELLSGLLRAERLVTLVGPPGVGKTRLVLEMGATRSSGFRDGVVFCELAGVAIDEIGSAVAAALGIQRRAPLSAEATVIEWLRERTLLVILDNCEDAIEPIGQLADDIVRSAPGCSILATSRQSLDVRGERVVRLQPLELPDDDDPTSATLRESPAVELFLQRAADAGVELAIDDSTLAVVAQLCRTVAGVPLAIELAAANTPILALDELLSAIDSGNLAGQGRSAFRHRTVHDALQWTYDAQAPELQEAFRRSSVFAGSFDREAFGAVCAPGRSVGDVVDILRALVDRSLMTADTSLGRARFQLLEPVRSFADTLLDDDERTELRSTFAAHIVVWAERVARELRGPHEARNAPLVALEFDNLRAVFGWSIAAADAPTALRLVSALWDYAFMRMRTEIFDWAERAAELSEAAGLPARSDALGIASLGAWVREDPDTSARLAAEAFRLERDEQAPRTFAVRLATQNSARYSDAGRAAPDVFREIVELSEALGEPYWLVNVDVLQSIGRSLAGLPDRAHVAGIAALERARSVGNPSSIAWAMFALALAIEPSDPEHAEEVLDDALTHARSVDNRWVGAMCMARLVSVRRRLRGAVEALPLLMELLDLWERAGHRSHLWSSLDQAALCLAELGDDAAAITIHRAATTAQLAMPPLPGDARAMDDALDRIRVDHGDDAVATWSRRATGLDLAGTLALASRRLGLLLEA